MNNRTIDHSLNQRILSALKSGIIRAVDFPEFSDHKNELALTEPEREFISSIYERIKADPKLLDIYSPEIKLDRSFKICLLKSLAAGFVASEDMPYLKLKAVDLSFAMSRDERRQLIDIVERLIDC
jgi:hypothetical protein